MKRLFIAFDLSDNQDVIKIYNELKHHLIQDKIGWVKAENMHITLKFLGATPTEKTDKIIEIMENACKIYPPIALEFSKVGLFGSRYNPRVIWLGFTENESLNQIAAVLKTNLVTLGFENDRQNFVPHLTLGRINKIESKQYFQFVLDKFKTLNLNPITINKIFLYESVLLKTGPEYRILKEIKFKY